MLRNTLAGVVLVLVPSMGFAGKDKERPPSPNKKELAVQLRCLAGDSRSVLKNLDRLDRPSSPVSPRAIDGNRSGRTTPQASTPSSSPSDEMFQRYLAMRKQEEESERRERNKENQKFLARMEHNKREIIKLQTSAASAFISIYLNLDNGN